MYSKPNGKWKTDDFLSSHEDPKVNDDLLKWMNKLYGKHGKVTATRGNTHEYLGMTFIFKNGKLKVNMREFPIKFNNEKKVRTPAGVDMFSEDTSK